MDDIYSCDPTGEVTAGENTIPEEQPGNDVSALPESAEHVIAADQEEAFSSTDYSFPNIKNDSDPGEYADETTKRICDWLFRRRPFPNSYLKAKFIVGDTFRR